MIMKFLKHTKPVYLIIGGIVGSIVIIGMVIAVIYSMYPDKKVKIVQPPRPSGQLLANISIGGNGELRASSLLVTENSWGTVTATSSIAGKSFSFVIKTDEKTVVKIGNQTVKLSDIKTGYAITLAGTVIEFTSDTITVLAKEIRTLSSFQQSNSTNPRTPQSRPTATSTIKSIPLKK